jgi:putative ABC transport system substrate-binding protein
MNNRRKLVIALGAGALTAPFAPFAQQPPMPVVGFLSSVSPDLFAERIRAFRQGLSEAGYVEGRNVAIETRSANDQYDRLPALADDLVRRQVAVIVAPSGVAAARAAKAATTTIPIVFGLAVDPVKFGLVPNLNRPGGNLTGVVSLNAELGPKRLELLREVVPGITSVAALVNPNNPLSESLTKDLQAAARTLRVTLHVLHASNERDLATVFASLAQLKIGALVVGTDPFFNSRGEQLATLALRYAMPAIYQYREFTSAGGLMSYGGSTTEVYRQIGAYTGRILKGEKPGDLPVQQMTRIELIVNMKTAKALGIKIPNSVLVRADTVIE